MPDAAFIARIKHLLLHDALTAADFEPLALEVFRWQAARVPVYRAYLVQLGIQPEKVRTLEQIPFLPISFFKTHRVHWEGASAPQTCFESSGTTGSQPSRHYIFDMPFAQQIAQRIFEQQYGALGQFELLALLPSYLERSTSSLVAMVQHFIQHTAAGSGFYLYDTAALLEQLAQPSAAQKLLLGVTFALTDLAAQGIALPPCIVMETGGMKGRKQEMIRADVHALLRNGLGITSVHSEYGMTELTSQAYSQARGIFRAPAWLRPLVRQTSDPFALQTVGSGGLNLIDLANIKSCAFIETQDLGTVYPDGTFEVLGRFDNADLRGCNLMVVG